MAEEIIQKNCLEQYKFDMSRYGIEVNMKRTAPDYRDGLKLVHRRILYAMGCKLPCKTRQVKSAQVTGKVIGEFHPHGDTSVYEAAVNMCNWWSTYIPLLASETSMGSIQGGRAAAQRYTEMMVSDFAKDVIFKELSETPKVVDWTPTYSGDDVEPEYLPTMLPLLLINGTFGIALGKQISVPPHNINEVIDATLKLIKNPKAEIVLIPDQCQCCEIVDTDWKQICNSGVGNFKVRGIIDIETIDAGKNSEHFALVIRSTPDMVNLDETDSSVKATLDKLINEGKLPQIAKMREDSSEEHGMKYTIHLKKGADPQYVKDFLYKATNLQKTQSVNFEVVHDLTMTRMSYKSYLLEFLEQRKLAKFRYYCIKLQKIRTDLHEKEACIAVIKSGKINEIIKKIQTSRSKNDEELVIWLVKLLSITDMQAKFILNYPIKKLAPSYLKGYEEAATKLRVIENQCMDMIVDENKILGEIADDLIALKEKYGFPPKRKLISANEIANIPQGTFNVVITENNFIRKLPENEVIGSVRGDNPVAVVKIENTSDVIFITAQGRMFKFPVHKIPITERSSAGIDIRILVKGISSEVVEMFDASEIKRLAGLTRKFYAVMVTKGNYIKKLDLEDLLVSTQGGIIMTKLNPGDLVKDIKIIPDDLDIIIYSDRKALRCKMKDIPNYKRNTLGVFAMNTNNEIDGISAIDKTDTDIVVITDSGKANKFSASGLSLGKRYMAGNSVIKLGKTEKIVAMYGTKDSYVINLITKNSRLNIRVSDITRSSSVSSGVKIINMKGDMILKTRLIYTVTKSNYTK